VRPTRGARAACLLAARCAQSSSSRRTTTAPGSRATFFSVMCKRNNGFFTLLRHVSRYQYTMQYPWSTPAPLLITSRFRSQMPHPRITHVPYVSCLLIGYPARHPLLALLDNVS
jgi:hypothetical protein